MGSLGNNSESLLQQEIYLRASYCCPGLDFVTTATVDTQESAISKICGKQVGRSSRRRKAFLHAIEERSGSAAVAKCCLLKLIKTQIIVSGGGLVTNYAQIYGPEYRIRVF